MKHIDTQGFTELMRALRFTVRTRVGGVLISLSRPSYQDDEWVVRITTSESDESGFKVLSVSSLELTLGEKNGEHRHPETVKFSDVDVTYIAY